MYEICQNTRDERTQAVRYIILLCLQFGFNVVLLIPSLLKCIITKTKSQLMLAMNENKEIEDIQSIILTWYTVWHDLLLRKLHIVGVKDGDWKIIDEWYKQLTSRM